MNFSEHEIQSALRNSADQNNIVTASRLRQYNRNLYTWFCRSGYDWRAHAQRIGLTTSTTYPRGYWTQPERIIDVLKLLADQLGRSPTRQELVDHRYGSANARIDELFGGIDAALKSAGLPPASASGRPDHWIEDTNYVRRQLELHVRADGKLPNHVSVRRADSSLAELLSRRFGSWERAATHYGFDVANARQRWSVERLETMFREAMDNRTPPASTTAYSILGSAYVRAVKRKFGSWKNFLQHMGYSDTLLAPQGYRVDSHGEWRIAVFLHHAGIPSERLILTIKGNSPHPDFVVPASNDSGFLVIEVLMVGEDAPSNERETQYSLRWDQKIELYEDAGIPYTTVKPHEFSDPPTLIARLLKAIGKDQNTENVRKLLSKWRPYSQPIWTLSKIESSILDVSNKIGGYMPTQTQLRELATKGLTNAIYRRGLTLKSLQIRLGLSSPPPRAEFADADAAARELLKIGRKIGRRPRAAELRQIHFLALKKHFGGLPAAWEFLTTESDRQ